MPTVKIKAYDAVISCDWLGDDASVLLGVASDYECEWWEYDDGLDSKIYYYLTEEEMANLKAGDVLNDGEDFTIVSIDKDNPSEYEINWEDEE